MTGSSSKSYLLFVYGKYLMGYNILKLAIVFKGKKDSLRPIKMKKSKLMAVTKMICQLSFIFKDQLL
ncbi:hypothetical protein DVW02_13845 [Clostridium botulinum]|nr:hypothetical protein [Clostridium botulinum]